MAWAGIDCSVNLMALVAEIENYDQIFSHYFIQLIN